MKNYPRGKLSDDDEGECSVMIFNKDKTVIVNFGKELTWIGFPKENAIAFAQSIINKANQL